MRLSGEPEKLLRSRSYFGPTSAHSESSPHRLGTGGGANSPSEPSGNGVEPKCEELTVATSRRESGAGDAQRGIDGLANVIRSSIAEVRPRISTHSGSAGGTAEGGAGGRGDDRADPVSSYDVIVGGIARSRIPDQEIARAVDLEACSVIDCVVAVNPAAPGYSGDPKTGLVQAAGVSHNLASSADSNYDAEVTRRRDTVSHDGVAYSNDPGSIIVLNYATFDRAAAHSDRAAAPGIAETGAMSDHAPGYTEDSVSAARTQLIVPDRTSGHDGALSHVDPVTS